MGWLANQKPKPKEPIMANSEPTTALETLGTYLSGNETRDAIHLAVVPITAVEKVFPGQHLAADGTPRGELVGIVDPFLPGPVQVGQRFWLTLYPRTITSLRHAWTHPAFPDTAAAAPASVSDKAASEAWLRAFISSSDCPSYEIVMAEASKVADGDNRAWSDEYLHFNEYDAHGEIPGEFWDHVEVVLGRKIQATRPAYFSCSC
jgi:hypothetical protein